MRLSWILLVFISTTNFAQNPDNEGQYFGENVSHEFIWLEDTESEASQQWLDRQDELLRQEFSKSDFNKFNRRLVFNNKPLQINSGSYSFTLKRYDDYPPVLMSMHLTRESLSLPIIKCNDLKRTENDFPTIVDYWVSEAQNRLVAAISHSGSDWIELVVFDIYKREFLYSLNGIINPWILFHNDGFIYEQYDIPTEGNRSLRINQRLSFHSFNSSQSEDRALFQNTDQTHQRTFHFSLDENHETIILYHPLKIGGEWREAISVLNLRNPHAPLNLLMFKSDIRLEIEYIFHSGDEYYFHTNLISPTYGIIKVSTSNPGRFETFLPGYKEVLLHAELLENDLIGLKYLDKGKFIGQVIDMNLETKIYFPVPEGVTLDYYKAKGDIYVRLEGFYGQPVSVKLKVSENGITFDSTVPVLYPEDILVEIISYENTEGAMVPAYLVRNTRKMDSKGKPAMIEVYGGYGSIIEPAFSWENYYFVKNGGVLMIPAVRGSGALGAEWAEAGAGIHKQNTVNDIISAAEFLIKQKYSTPDLLLLKGTSHGGFAVAAAAIQRPELFKGVIARAAPMDLVRITDESVGNLVTNRIEYGDPDKKESFMSRWSLSPIHNLKENVNYPSFLLITGKYDTRVPPSNSYRFMEALSTYSSNDLNYLYVTNGGHYITNTPEESLELLSLELKFMYLLTGVKFWL
jgi:prolyl oligopeptidase